MSDLKDLYRNAIVDHCKTPVNFHELKNANRQGRGDNPLCGDKLSVFIHIVNNVITDMSFTGSGCAIAVASASMMTENLKGKTETEARKIFQQFMDLISGCPDPPPDASLGNLSVFSGVRGYPARVKCAALAWKTFLSALEGNQEIVETE
jgi:nitrogen fixation NifU-like protein